MRDLNNKDQLIGPFLTHKRRILSALEKLVGKRGEERRAVGLSYERALNGTLLVMTANEGHSTMVINFFCDLHRWGRPTPRHVIFATVRSGPLLWL